MKPDKTFWIIFGVVLFIVALITYPNDMGKKHLLGKCFVAYSSQDGDSILKITKQEGSKIFGEITDKKSGVLVQGLFSQKELKNFKPISCP